MLERERKRRKYVESRNKDRRKEGSRIQFEM
jgi:hypothetical protein